jgi:putative ATP-dependent endonuclease of OLD family
LKQLNFFFNGIGRGVNINDLKFKREEDRELLVELTFSQALDGAAQMKHEGNRAKIEKILDGCDEVVVRRSSSNHSKRKVLINGQEVNTGTGFDSALNDFLPKFEYVNTKQYYDSVAKYAKATPMGVMLSDVLTTILENNKQYQQFQEKFRELFEDDDSQIKTEFENIGNKVKIYLEKQFPDCTKVKFEVAEPIFEDLLKNFNTTVDDGIETSAEEKGDGMQRALMLAIIQAYADHRRSNDDSSKSFVFFIDEAELHLHPTAQRNLKNALYELSLQSDQVFINTHSSVFVADNYQKQAIFKVEKNNGATSIVKVTDFEKPYMVYELLGGSPADLLLPRNFLIVEGQSEFEFFSRVIQRFYSDKPTIQIIKANGDIDQAERTINAIEKTFSPLEKSIYKDRTVILIDQPSQEAEGGVKQFLNNNKYLKTNNQFFQLPVRAIELYYPSQPDPIYGNWRKSPVDLDAKNSDGAKIFNNRKKKGLAKAVGDKITKMQFEEEMNVCYNTLQRCWELAYL